MRYTLGQVRSELGYAGLEIVVYELARDRVYDVLHVKLHAGKTWLNGGFEKG